MFEMREVIYNDQQYTVSYSTNRGSSPWVITNGWETVTGQLKKQVKQQFLRDLGVNKMEDYCSAKTISLDCCTTASVPYTSIGSKPAWGILKNKEEDNMRNELVITANATTSAPDQSKRDFLGSELYTAFYGKEEALRKTYGLDEDESPKTPKEYVKRIQDGKFVLTKCAELIEEDDYFDSYVINRYITWRDPAVKEDKAGFKTALALVEAARKDTARTITIGTPEEGLAALKAFEAQTFSVN